MEEKLYKIIFHKGNLRFLVATDLNYEECEELIKKQLEPECYDIEELN